MNYYEIFNLCSISLNYSMKVIFATKDKYPFPMEWACFKIGVWTPGVVAIQNKKRQPAKSTIFCPSNLNKYWAVKHFAKIYARLFDQLSTKCPNLNMIFIEKY